MKRGRVLLLMGLIGFISSLNYFTALVFNLSHSLPHKAFFVLKQGELRRGDYVYFKWNNLKVIKQIEGIESDKIEVKEGFVKINGVIKGTLIPQTSQGLKLIPINSQIIPKNYYFVMTRYPYSHDSRYADFGLIHKDQIIGKGFGVGGGENA